MMTMKNADYEKCPFTIVGMIKELHRKIHAGSKEAVEKALEHLTSYIVPGRKVKKPIKNQDDAIIS